MYSYCIEGIVGSLLSLWTMCGEISELLVSPSERTNRQEISFCKQITSVVLWSEEVLQTKVTKVATVERLFALASTKVNSLSYDTLLKAVSSWREALQSEDLQYVRTEDLPTTTEMNELYVSFLKKKIVEKYISSTCSRSTSYELSTKDLFAKNSVRSELLSWPLLSSDQASFTDVDVSIYPPPGHTLWTKLLKIYVNEKGLVDYARWRREPTQLRAYLNWLRKNVPTKDRPRTERLAYWINLYNAFTIELILRNYPVKSIRDIRTQSAESPWKIDFINLPTAKLSLDNVENDIIRKHFLEPRIHFALVCAAVSCPPLRREAYLSNRLSVQLEDQARRFLQDPTKNRTKNKQLHISELFKWFEEDFKQGGGVLNYISKYVKSPLPVGATISYMTYDWGLNEQK